MKKLNQLLIIEADDTLSSLFSQFQMLLQSLSHAPVRVQSLQNFTQPDTAPPPQLVLLHSDLTTTEHVQQFIQLRTTLPYSTIIIVSDNQDEELCLSALEAGADDTIKTEQVTMSFMRKTILLSLRRSRIEKALQESEDRYHTLFNQTTEAIFINDEEGRFLDMNKKACELLGYIKEQLLEMRVTDVYSPEEPTAWPVMWKTVFNSNCTYTERNIFRSNGEIIPVEITAKKFKDGLIMSIARNISEKKKTEEALIQSEEKYSSLVEQQADAISIFNEEGKILDVNTSAIELLQYSRDELQHMTLTDILSAEETKSNPIRFDLLKKGESTIKQRKMRRKDGLLVETEVHTKKLFEGIFLASVRDLSERIEVQHKLEKEKELSDSIINSLPGLFYLFTKTNKYLRWNKQLEIISGYTAHEISESSPLDFVIEEARPDVQKAIHEAFKKGISSVETELVTKDGKKIPYYFTGIAIQYAGDACLLGTGIDLSPLKTLEKELVEQKIAGQKKIMQAMIDAEEKEKNKLGLELHDNVNQILSVVKMYLTIINSGEVLPEVTLPKAMQLLNTAIGEIRHLSHSLAISYKFQTGITEALEEMIENIKLTRDFSIELATPPDLDEQTTNHQKLALYRIIQEQLNNIIKYAKASVVKVQIEMNDKEISLTVSDNGRGFDLLLPRKGLGLNNIINRAEALGGKISIQSAPGKGCTLVATIPLESIVYEQD